MGHLPVQRDREVLERYYLQEEPRTAIRESLQLTEMQFNQVLWRARQRFGEILRRHGLALGECGAAQSTRWSRENMDHNNSKRIRRLPAT